MAKRLRTTVLVGKTSHELQELGDFQTDLAGLYVNGK